MAAGRAPSTATSRAKKAAPSGSTATKKAAAKKAPAAKKPAAKKAVATKAAVKKAPATKVGAKKAPATKAAATKATKAPAANSAAKKVPAKAMATKAAATKAAAPAAVAAAKQAPATKAPAKKAPAKKAAAKKTAVKGAQRKYVVRADETPWTTAELGAIRAELLADTKRLKSEIAIAEHDIADLLRDSGDGAGDDQADAGTKTFEREHEMSLANNSRDMVLQNERAIGRIADGTYGVCESCGNPIGKARLQAFPRATLCVSCKQREERR